MTRSHVSPWVTRGLYLFAFLLVVSPVVDLVTTVWPPRPGELAWRYGLLGLLAGYLQTPVLGLILAMGVAYWRGHGGVLRLSGVLAFVAVVGLVLAMGGFALDVIQMRAVRAEGARTGILIGGAVQEVKYAAAIVVLVFLGLGAIATAKDVRRRHRDMEGPRVVARSSHRGAPPALPEAPLARQQDPPAE